MCEKKRQKYYERLCAMGMPEVISASMAQQSKHLKIWKGANLMSLVYSFEAWQDTKEGFDFWSDFVDCL